MKTNANVEIFPMVINGKTVEGNGGEFIDVCNPATEEVIGQVPVAVQKDIESAVSSAFAAFKAWREIPAAERAALMMKFVQAVQENSDNIARTLTREQGKPLWQARAEINGFCAVMEFYAQEARRTSGIVLQSDHRDRFVYVLRQPIGVVAAIPPWNDPLHLLSRMMGPDLAVGCTVVAKPASETPLATIEMALVAHEAGFPSGVFNVITGPGSRVGEALVRHPLVAKVALTGSVQAGQQVLKVTAEGIKRVTLELGGQCPCIVWNDADLDKAADAITFQAFRSAGQVCNRVNRVYAHADIHDQLAQRVAELASRIVVGEGFQEGIDIGPLINKRQLEWVVSQVEDAVAKGARVLTGGCRIGDKGYFYKPTVLVNCNHTMQVMSHETFGPVLAFMEIANDLDKAFEYANDSIYGLSAYFFSADMRKCYLAAQHLEAGSIWINDIHGSMVQAPYGGMKQSGIGREQSSLAVNEYLEWKTVYQEMSYESRGKRLCVHHESEGNP